MKIHEYQAKELFRKYGIPVPRGAVLTNAEQATQVAERLASFPLVVKAQVHAGGRGKGGGVRRAANSEELTESVAQILGMTLVTPQTGPAGRLVRSVLIEEAADIASELYLSLLIDRASAAIVVMASLAGGMDIEETADKHPEKIVKVTINPLQGVMGHHVRQLLFGLQIDKAHFSQWRSLLAALYALFVENDCSLVEINPLIVTTSGKLLAIDAKIALDSNALFRHPELQELRDADEEDPLEVEARSHNLNYIRLSGNVGNMVNGAGLAMATMDIIKKAGAEPANFLDVGGGATAEMVEKGFAIILTDTNVKAILINIFGGILRCDVLARGIVQAAKNVGVNVPLVIRMEGTNVEEGRRILAESGLALVTAENLADAATKIAELVT